MLEWIGTMVLMAIARILSLEQDSPYLRFCCLRRMEFLTKMLFSAISQILYEGFFVWRSGS